MRSVMMAAAIVLAAGVTTPAFSSTFARDRQAILAMTGEYDVTFSFAETVPVSTSYECTKPYTTDAKELVVVARDTGREISLQHILVVEKDDGTVSVVKHWRQDWTYEDRELTVYRGHDTWETVELDAATARGAWTQAVYQVDDSPRYESIGTWSHIGDHSTWQSGETWRPLPRREYTKRSDYHVMLATNRHTITPDGWVHEQHNVKLVLHDDGSPSHVIAHETGLNVYAHDSSFDFSVASSYWATHGEFWVDVQEAWLDVLEENRRVRIEKKIDGERLSARLKALRPIDASADAISDAPPVDRARLKAMIRDYVVNAG